MNSCNIEGWTLKHHTYQMTLIVNKLHGAALTKSLRPSLAALPMAKLNLQVMRAHAKVQIMLSADYHTYTSQTQGNHRTGSWGVYANHLVK